MSTNLEYRAGERQRNRERRRQASEAQREKGRQRSRARDKKPRRHFFVGRTTWKFCSGGDKMRNARGHQCKVKMSDSEKTSEREHVRSAVSAVILSWKLSSRRFRDFIICHNLYVVLFLALYSIRHLARPHAESKRLKRACRWTTVRWSVNQKFSHRRVNFFFLATQLLRGLRAHMLHCQR